MRRQALGARLQSTGSNNFSEAMNLFLGRCDQPHESRDGAGLGRLWCVAEFRRARTDVIQAEARKTGLRYDSRYENLEQRDREIANSGVFRKSLYDYDVEKAALAHVSATRSSTN